MTFEIYITEMTINQSTEDSVEADLYSEKICTETRNRIRLSLAAYAYEILNKPIMSDADFDQLSKQIDPNQGTRRPDLDKWFRENFNCHTGMWIHDHPEKERLRQILTAYFHKN
jgi:hypothetical protein